MNRLVDEDEQFFIGQRLLYKSPYNQFPDGIYFAEVTNIYKHHITLRIVLDQSTAKACYFGQSIPYNVNVMKVNIGKVEKLMYN